MSFDLKEIILRVPGTVYWKNIDGVYLGCNQNQADILGLAFPDDIIGKTLSDLLPPELIKSHEENDRHVFESGQDQVYEEMGLGPNGSILIYLSRKVPVKDKDGKIVGLLGLSIDITKYKQNEEALTDAKKDVEANLNKIANFLPGNIFWKDKRHRYLGCNENMAKMLGLKSPNDIIGKTNSDFPFMSSESVKLAEANDKLVLESGKEIVFEEKGVDAHGDSAVYLSQKIPLFEGAKVVGTLGVGTDITERKKFEQELKKAKNQAEIANKVKTEFLMNMSHDLRTPLSGIMGFLDILIKEESSAEKKEKLGYALESSKNLLKIIEEIIDVVDQDAHKKLELENFKLSEAVKSCCELLKPEIIRKGLSLTINIDPEFPQEINGDRKRLEKLLLNLMTNAVKFTDKGFIDVTVNLLNKSDKKIEYEIRVQDSGCGIESENLEKIFDRFTRVQSVSKQKISGSGLGLWFVRNIINELNGHISVESVVGKGSTFICRLPSRTHVSNESHSVMV